MRRRSMRELNQITIEGFITEEPLIRKLNSGKTVCSFSLTCHHNSQNEDRKVSFFDVETWEKLAASCVDRVRKGRRVVISGSLRQDRWQDSDGKPHSKVKLVGNEVRYLTGIKEEELLKSAAPKERIAQAS